MPRTSAELTKNDQYWDRTRIPRLDRILLLPMPEATTRLAALRSGQVDWIEVPPPDAIQSLRQAGFTVIEHPFPDHHAYTVDELHFTPPAPLVMTEKDAVKCRGLAPADSWMVPVRAMLPPSFWQTLMTRLAAWRPPHA